MRFFWGELVNYVNYIKKLLTDARISKAALRNRMIKAAAGGVYVSAYINQTKTLASCFE
jgi:hypothetical protein